MGSSLDRDNSSRGDARLFVFLLFLGAKTVFRLVDVSMCFVVFCRDVFSKNDPEVSGSGRGASPTY